MDLVVIFNCDRGMWMEEMMFAFKTKYLWIPRSPKKFHMTLGDLIMYITNEKQD